MLPRCFQLSVNPTSIQPESHQPVHQLLTSEEISLRSGGARRVIWVQRQIAEGLNRVHIQSSSTFSLRARELYESLPASGSAEQRWSVAKQSLDTLALEFSHRPENQLIKLTHGLAKKLNTKVDQEALFRTALGAAADGCLASGAGLAGLGLKLAALAPPEQRQRLEHKVWTSLADRPELQGIADLGNLAQPGWLQTKNAELDRALLRSACEGFDQRETAMEILRTPIEGRPLQRLVSSQTNDPTVLAVLDSPASLQQQRGFVWDFLAQPAATPSQTAQSAKTTS